LAAVEAGDSATAIALAEKICPPGDWGQCDPRYAPFFQRNGLDKSFLEGPFNSYDFGRWHYAHCLKQLSGRLTGGNPDNIEALYHAVVARVESKDDDKDAGFPWPWRIWERGYGLCDRQAWVLCAMAYQCGWETQIIYLIDPRSGQSPHTICSMRKGLGLVYVADPNQKFLMPQKSVDDILADRNLLDSLWPQRPEFRAALANCVFWTPSYPQDYCPRNQRLWQKLKPVLGDRCPRFGADPIGRLQTYAHLRQLTHPGAQLKDMRPWDYPIRLLAEQMASGGDRRAEHKTIH
jgi:hypothetical protein